MAKRKKNPPDAKVQVPQTAGPSGPDLSAQAAFKEKEKKFKELLEGFQQTDRLGLEQVVALGTQLESIKASLGHGNWLPWAKKNAEQYGVKSERTFERWMRVARARKEGKLEGVKGLTEANQLVADSSGKVRNPLPKDAIQSSQIRTADVSNAVRNHVGNQEQIQAVTVRSAKIVILRKAVAKVMKEHAKILQKTGGVIIIKPAPESENTPKKKAMFKMKK